MGTCQKAPTCNDDDAQERDLQSTWDATNLLLPHMNAMNLPSKSSGVWNSMPMRRLTMRTFSLVMSSPSRKMESPGGSHNRLIALKRVDFPLPLGPMIPTTCPAWMSTEMPVRIWLSSSTTLSKLWMLILAEEDLFCNCCCCIILLLLLFCKPSKSSGILSKCSVTSSLPAKLYQKTHLQFKSLGAHTKTFFFFFFFLLRMLTFASIAGIFHSHRSTTNCPPKILFCFFFFFGFRGSGSCPHLLQIVAISRRGKIERKK